MGVNPLFATVTYISPTVDYNMVIVVRMGVEVNPLFATSLPQCSLVALAVLGCDLKLLGCDWLTVIVTLQSLAQVRGGELSVCYEAVAPHYSMAALRYPLAISSNVTDKIKEVGVTSPKDNSYPKCRETTNT